MYDTLENIKKVAPTDARVLITGETGTGKTLLAHDIHNKSLRSGKKMIIVNWPTVPSGLLESYLCGHKKGSYTNAYHDRKGKIEEADGSTLFLDEIGSMPLDLQVKLLHFLDYGEYEVIGDNKIKNADVRIIASTNMPLEKMMREGKFREDLFYRLSVIRINLPPLRDRKDDIPELADYFIGKYIQKHKRDGGNTSLSHSTEKGFIDNLQSYNWPGNVRELENVIEHAVVMAGDDMKIKEINPIHEKLVNQHAGIEYINQEKVLMDVCELILNTDITMEKLNNTLIELMLKLMDNNQSKTAEAMGLSRVTIRSKMKKVKH